MREAHARVGAVPATGPQGLVSLDVVCAHRAELAAVLPRTGTERFHGVDRLPGAVAGDGLAARSALRAR
ncbi:hypothetical protein [Streptomyces corynorhini]|uniref:Uncharacterized protein n=1 Tax=Streptomyces corynorhini TaxID=2282652 RepID=A0A370B697_9ACTN|nr:hypothetical protein [Streptomyces corynorhini]RDG37121.1 hypothetical protein DVH02_16545 [Streptomyces corynorhini]